MNTKNKFACVVISQFLCFAFATGQTDPWKCVNGNGFGDIKNIACSQFFNFKGNIYTSTQRSTGNPPGQIWYSTSGDTNTWTKITSYSPPLGNSDLSIFCGGITDSSGGIAFISTLNRITGTALYRSTDGISWTMINSNGFGIPGNYRTSPTITVFQDSLYAATWNNNGAQIWRCHSANTTPSNWKKVLDFSITDTMVKDLTYLMVWNGKIYVTTNGNSTAGGELYESSNGSVWSKNTGVGNGFGTPQNNLIASMIEFNNELYAGTLNQIGGGQLWKTTNGVLWTQVTGNAFGQGSVIRELKRMAVAGGYLWVSGNPSAGNSDEVWKSPNGATFTQSNVNGFGDPNNASFPMLGTFNNYTYYGGQNTVSGGQIWRTCVTPVAGFNPTASTFCQGSIITFTNSTLYGNTYQWSNNSISFSALQNATLTLNNPGVNSIMLHAYTGTCHDSLAQSFTVTALPSFSVATVNASCPLCSNGQATASGLSGSTPFQYSWDNGTYSTATSASNLATGSHTLCVKDANSCISCSTFSIGATNGIANFNAPGSCSLFPNPSQGNLFFSGNPAEQYSISVYNMNGELLSAQEIQGNSHLDLQALANGIYYITLYKDNLAARMRIVILK